MILSNEELWIKCAEWGSCITIWDRGACMYNFNGTSGFAHRKHAEVVIDWVTNHCFAAAELNDNPEADKADLEDILETARAYLEKE